MNERSTDRTVLITGSNSGVGSACVRRFLADGWRVIATFHKRVDRIAELRSDLHLEMHALDVAEALECKTLADRLTDAGVVLNALIVVSSYNEPPLWNVDPLRVTTGSLLASFAVEVAGLHNLLVSLTPLFVEGAAVVTFSSASAHHGDPDTFCFNLSKVAVSAYTRMLAKTTSAFRINALALDSVVSDWLSEWDISTEQLQNFRVMKAGAKRLGRPEEVASLAAFLCSDDASYLSGQTLILDGGAG